MCVVYSPTYPCWKNFLPSAHFMEPINWYICQCCLFCNQITPNNLICIWRIRKYTRYSIAKYIIILTWISIQNSSAKISVLKILLNKIDRHGMWQMLRVYNWRKIVVSSYRVFGIEFVVPFATLLILNVWCFFLCVKGNNRRRKEDKIWCKVP